MGLLAAALFVIAAFAAGGDTLGGIPMWCWGFAGFAVWVLSGGVSLPFSIHKKD